MLRRKSIKHALTAPDSELKSSTYYMMPSKDTGPWEIEGFDSDRMKFETSEGSNFAWKCKAATGGFRHLHLKLKQRIRHGNRGSSSLTPSSGKFAEKSTYETLANKHTFGLDKLSSFYKGHSFAVDFYNTSRDEKSNVLNELGSYSDSSSPYKLEVVLPDSTFWDDFKDITEKYDIKAPLEGDSANALNPRDCRSVFVINCHESNFQISPILKPLGICENNTCTKKSTYNADSVIDHLVVVPTHSRTVLVESQDSHCLISPEASAEVIEDVTEVLNPSPTELLLPELHATTESFEQDDTDETEHFSKREEAIPKQNPQLEEILSLSKPEEPEEIEKKEDNSSMEESSYDDISKEAFDLNSTHPCDGTVVGRELSIKYNTGRMFRNQKDYIDASTGVEFRYNRWGDPEELVPYGYQRNCHRSSRPRSLKSVIRNLERRPSTVIQYSKMMANVESLHRANLIAYRREATILLDCISSSEEDKPFTFIMSP